MQKHPCGLKGPKLRSGSDTLLTVSTGLAYREIYYLLPKVQIEVKVEWLLILGSSVSEVFGAGYTFGRRIGRYCHFCTATQVHQKRNLETSEVRN